MIKTPGNGDLIGRDDIYSELCGHERSCVRTKANSGQGRVAWFCK